MTEKINRRDFFRAALAFSAVAGGGRVVAEIGEWADKEFNSPLDLLKNDKALTEVGARKIVFRLDELGDKVEEFAPEPFRNTTAAQAFVIEIAPYSVYEEILPEVSTIYGFRYATREVMPRVYLRHYGGVNSFHLGGTAACHDTENPSIDINIKYHNPESPWYDRESQVSVLVHETMHINGVCSDDTRSAEWNNEVETATQLATIEVLAAATRHGNKNTLLPFIREVQGFASDLILRNALENGTIEDYQKRIVDKTANDAIRKAGFAKSMDHWKTTIYNRLKLKQIISDYGEKPYRYMVEALNNEKLETRKLPFPNARGVIKMDDTAYCLEHLDGIVESYIARRKAEQNEPGV